eukprot:4548960-Ditylum_brightwellii.AAC.1
MAMKGAMALLMKRLMMAHPEVKILVIMSKVQAEVPLGKVTMAETEPMVKVAKVAKVMVIAVPSPLNLVSILMRTMIHPFLHCVYSWKKHH